MPPSPLIMGVVNITPDSFSDGGDFSTTDSAIRHALSLLEDGADIIDLGAESTRPGAQKVDAKTEWSRLEPVLKSLVKSVNPDAISVDTRNSETAVRAAQEFEIGWINHVGGVFEPAVMVDLAAMRGLKFIAMHMQGTPDTMQVQPLKGSQAVVEVANAFAQYKYTALAAGFESERVYYDPGIGFGKDDAANIKLIAATQSLSESYRLCVGISRKSFLGRLLDIPQAKDRDAASKTLEFGLWLSGASIVRTHSVRGLQTMRQLWLAT